MSISIALDGVLQTQVASNSGWNDFCRWVGHLPSSYSHLKHLCLYGWSETLDQVNTQLRKALASPKYAPDDDVASVGRDLAELLDGRDDGQTVLTITDGLTK